MSENWERRRSGVWRFFICGMCHFLAKPQSSGGEVAFILQLCISNQQSAIHVNLPEDSYFCLLALTSNVQRLIVLAMFCICSCLHQPRQAEWDQMEVCTFCDWQLAGPDRQVWLSYKYFDWKQFFGFVEIMFSAICSRGITSCISYHFISFLHGNHVIYDMFHDWIT